MAGDDRSGRTRARKRRTGPRNLDTIPVESIQAKQRNPANPNSYLTPGERAQRLAKLWREMFQRLNTDKDDAGANQSP